MIVKIGSSAKKGPNISTTSSSPLIWYLILDVLLGELASPCSPPNLTPSSLIWAKIQILLWRCATSASTHILRLILSGLWLLVLCSLLLQIGYLSLKLLELVLKLNVMHLQICHLLLQVCSICNGHLGLGPTLSSRLRSTWWTTLSSVLTTSITAASWWRRSRSHVLYNHGWHHVWEKNNLILGVSGMLCSPKVVVIHHVYLTIQILNVEPVTQSQLGPRELDVGLTHPEMLSLVDESPQVLPPAFIYSSPRIQL